MTSKYRISENPSNPSPPAKQTSPRPKPQIKPKVAKEKPQKQEEKQPQKQEEKAIEKPKEKPKEKPTEKPKAKPTEKPKEKPKEKPAEKLKEKPKRTEKPKESPAPTAAEEPVTNSTEKRKSSHSQLDLPVENKTVVAHSKEEIARINNALRKEAERIKDSPMGDAVVVTNLDHSIRSAVSISINLETAEYIINVAEGDKESKKAGEGAKRNEKKSVQDSQPIVVEEIVRRGSAVLVRESTDQVVTIEDAESDHVTKEKALLIRASTGEEVVQTNAAEEQITKNTVVTIRASTGEEVPDEDAVTEITETSDTQEESLQELITFLKEGNLDAYIEIFTESVQDLATFLTVSRADIEPMDLPESESDRIMAVIQAGRRTYGLDDDQQGTEIQTTELAEDAQSHTEAQVVEDRQDKEESLEQGDSNENETKEEIASEEIDEEESQSNCDEDLKQFLISLDLYEDFGSKFSGNLDTLLDMSPEQIAEFELPSPQDSILLVGIKRELLVKKKKTLSTGAGGAFYEQFS
eukprot:TRINITY_DN699_c0_g1_i4.p1 TRINITY_DN699_c0_g1~~TRINITY_DN699_c0_g1_i4.p1  ORF type:complete len:523 (+),score=144.67 TRINITY_DN699_c0_g1_i4:100-1668(+)